MKKKRWFTMIGSICLTLVLAALLLPACAPVEVPEEIAKLEVEIADLEDDVAAEKTKTAAEKAKVSDLEDEIAALKKPVEVLRWQTSTWMPAGVAWDTLLFLCDHVEKMSGGRIVMIPTAPGAICPVEEQIDAVATGVLPVLDLTTGYIGGKIPVFFEHNVCLGAPKSVADQRWLYEFYEGGRIQELLQEEVTKYGDVVMVKNLYRLENPCIVSNVPIYGVDDIDGVLFRACVFIADALEKSGAGIVFATGEELYTMLATGAIDALSYASAADDVAMSFHEVSKYWVRKPTMAGPACEIFVVNGAVWRDLPDDLKDILKGACEAANEMRVFNAEIEVAKAWKIVDEAGIEIIEWPDEDIRKWDATVRSLLPKYRVDAASNEFFDIVERFMVEMGYWE